MQCFSCLPTKYRAFSGFPPSIPLNSGNSINLSRISKYLISGVLNPIRVKTIVAIEFLTLLHLEHKNSDPYFFLHEHLSFPPIIFSITLSKNKFPLLKMQNFRFISSAKYFQWRRFRTKAIWEGLYHSPGFNPY